MNITEISSAVREARQYINGVRSIADEMISILLSVNLKDCDTYKLRQLKRVLRDFNSVNRCWK